MVHASVSILFQNTLLYAGYMLNTPMIGDDSGAPKAFLSPTSSIFYLRIGYLHLKSAPLRFEIKFPSISING